MQPEGWTHLKNVALKSWFCTHKDDHEVRNSYHILCKKKIKKNPIVKMDIFGQLIHKGNFLSLYCMFVNILVASYVICFLWCVTRRAFGHCALTAESPHRTAAAAPWQLRDPRTELSPSQADWQRDCRRASRTRVTSAIPTRSATTMRWEDRLRSVSQD